MPIPKPRKNEKQKAFVSRCHSALANEYKKQAQRHAVCMNAWRKAHETYDEERKVHTQFPFHPFIAESYVQGEPLKITGVAMEVGRSRNKNLYLENEVRAFMPKLKGAPIYIEHVSVFDAIGKVTDTWFKRPYGYYEGEIYDEDAIDKIRRGVVNHVSIGADYTTYEIVNGIMPKGLKKEGAEMSLVAVAGIPTANIRVLESLRQNRLSRTTSPNKSRIVIRLESKIREK